MKAEKGPELRQALGGKGELPGDWESTAVVPNLLRRCLVCLLDRGKRTRRHCGGMKKERKVLKGRDWQRKCEILRGTKKADRSNGRLGVRQRKRLSVGCM